MCEEKGKMYATKLYLRGMPGIKIFRIQRYFQIHGHTYRSFYLTTIFYRYYHELAIMECRFHGWRRICSNSCNHNPVLFTSNETSLIETYRLTCFLHDGCNIWSSICLPLKKHRDRPSVWQRSYGSVFIDCLHAVFLVTVCLFAFFRFSHGVLIFSANCKFEYPFGIFFSPF